MVTNPTPPPATPRQPDKDHRPSIRMALAASLLRHHHDPHDIAEQTRVPLALVELIAEHLDTPSASAPPQSTQPGDKPRHHLDDHDTADANPLSPPSAAEPRPPQPRARHRRRRTRTVVALALALLADSGLTAAAVITRSHALGATVILLTCLLLTVALLNPPSWAPSGPRPGRGVAPR